MFWLAGYKKVHLSINNRDLPKYSMGRLLQSGIGLLICTVWLCMPYSQGQASSWSPFDIRNRSAEWVDSVWRTHMPVVAPSTPNADIAEPDTTSELVNQNKDAGKILVSSKEGSPDSSGNPFDMMRSDPTDYEWQPMEALSESERTDADLLFMVMVLLIVIAGALVALHRMFVIQIFKALTRSNHLNILYRSQNTQMLYNRLLFYGFFFLSGGLFLYLALDFLNLDYWEKGFLLLLFCILLVGLIYGLKHLVLRFVGWVFQVEKIMDEYSFIISIFNAALGLLLIPVAAMLAFGPDKAIAGTTVAGMLLFAGLLLLRQFRVAVATLNKVLPFAFHFFIYLCAVEIAPVLLLASFFRSSF
jgi:hypothetical protein